MRSIRTFLMVSFIAMGLAGLATGCALDVAEEGEELDNSADTELQAPDEVLDQAGSAQEIIEAADEPAEPAETAETTVTRKPSDTSSARDNGDWCHAVCYNDRTYAGPAVTANCTDWANMVCQHRGTSLFQAFWCKPWQCHIDVIL